MTKFIIFCLLFVQVVWAAPLEEGYQALRAGNLDKSGRLFASIKGVDGQVARARRLMIMGRSDQALQELKGESVAVQVTKFETLVDAGYYTDARELLTELESLKHGNFPAPYRFRFYLTRGELEVVAKRFDLAKKNLNLALRLARSSREKLLVAVHRLRLLLAQEKQAEAESELEKASVFLKGLRDRWVLAQHMKMSARVHRAAGRLGTAALLNTARRELHLSHKNPVMAARALFANQSLLQLSNNNEGAAENCLESLEEFLVSGDYASVEGCLRNYFQLRYSTGNKGDLANLYEETLRRMPSGPHRDYVRLAYVFFLRNTDADPAMIQALCRRILRESQNEELKTHAHRVLAIQLRNDGQFEEALKSYDEALALARPQLRADRNWSNSPGPLTLSLAILELRRHRFSEAVRLTRKAVSVEPGRDWAAWRINARHQGLQAASRSFDVDATSQMMREGLSDLVNDDRLDQRASGVASLLSAIFINQSVEEDVADAGELAVGDYGILARTVIEDNFSDPEMVREVLASFDSWGELAEQTNQALVVAYPLIYKGFLLEALDRLPEAEVTLLRGIEKAQISKVKPAEMVGRLLLARVRRRQGKLTEAASQLATAAQLSITLNPQAARFYSLVAASVQREAGLYQESLVSYQAAINARPTRSWAAHFGRALSLEKMGRTEEALSSLVQGLGVIKTGNFRLPRAHLQGAQARLFLKKGDVSKALGLFEASHASFLNSGSAGALAEVSLDFIEGLLNAGQSDRAWGIAQTSLDKILQWHAPQEASTNELFEKTIALALGQGKTEEALRYLRLSKSLELINKVNLSDVEHSDPETERLLKSVEKYRYQLAKIQESAGKASDEQERDGLGLLLADTRAKFFKQLDLLKSREPEFEALVPLGGSQLSAIQKLLGEDAALVEYFAAENTLYVFLVTRNSLTLHEVSYPRRELEALIERYGSLVSDPQSKLSETHAVSKQLHTLLLGSISREIQGYNYLLFVPSGLLWEVPFNTLADEQGTTLNERFQVSYLSSADFMRIIWSRLNSEEQQRKALLQSGAPDLGGAKREISELAKALPESTVVTAQEGSVQEFRAAAPQHNLLHIASHSGLTPDGAYIQLGKEKLTLEQIYGLDLKPSTLVVLSSCQSQATVGKTGKEVTSLASAFGVAGASGIIASRWKIDDRATLEFFRVFYQELLGGSSTSQALRKAESKTKEKHPHPYYWAGFSLVGDPR